MDPSNELISNITNFNYNVYASFYSQQFSVPLPIIRYLTLFPSNSNIYQKLIQSCKHFFKKRPILVLHCFKVSDTVKQICIKNDCSTFAEFNYEKIAKQLWITEMLATSPKSSSKLISTIKPKIYRCDLAKLVLKKQTISMEAFKFLTKSVKICKFKKVSVKYRRKMEVPFERLIGLMPKLESLEYHFNPAVNNTSTFTVKKLLKIPHFTNIKKFWLYNIPENFNIEMFYFDLKRIKSQADVSLKFTNNLSFNYTTRLTGIIKIILSPDFSGLRTPYIEFEGLHPKKKEDLTWLKSVTEAEANPAIVDD